MFIFATISFILLATFNVSALPIANYSGDSQSIIDGDDEQHSTSATSTAYYLIAGVAVCLVLIAFLGGWFTSNIIRTLKSKRKECGQLIDESRSQTSSPNNDGDPANEESIVTNDNIDSITKNKEIEPTSTPMKCSNPKLDVSYGTGKKVYSFTRFVSNQNGVEGQRTLSLSEFTDSLSRIGDHYQRKPCFRVEESSIKSISLTGSTSNASQRPNDSPHTRDSAVHHSSPICKTTLSSPTLQRLLADRSRVPSLARLIKMDSDVPQQSKLTYLPGK